MKKEMLHEILIDGESLTIEDVVAVARDGAKVTIPETTENKVKECRRVLEEWVTDKRVIYGVTTGFGSRSREYLPSKYAKELQLNLIRSHCADVGKPLDRDVVRGMMVLRANSLAKGYSAIKISTLQTLVEMLNRRVHPIVPEKGSVGASGDLSPNAHIVLAMIGEGNAEFEGDIMTGGTALAKAGISKVELDSKEGLALVNGTPMMTAIAALAVYDAGKLVKSAEIASAMSLEALMGRPEPFDDRIQRVRPHEGQIICAENIRVLTSGSRFIERKVEKTSDEIVEVERGPQDSYCLRCIPQVLGAVRDAITYVKRVIETEINSATDNPLIFPKDNEILFGGNFHGQPVALALDFLGISLATIGNMSERRIAKLLAGNENIGLPSHLIPDNARKGLNTGIFIACLTAASLASENKVFAHPASVDSIPDPANFEDFVSMGPVAARKAVEILRNVQYIVAIELLCAAQALDFRDPRKLGKGTKITYNLVRDEVAHLKEDRPIYKDTERVFELVRSGKLAKQVEHELDELK
jgi:histidine ammonia-lyase